MKKFLAVSAALLMGVVPILGTAQAQTRPPADSRIEQRAPQEPETRQGPQASTTRHWAKGQRYNGNGFRVSNYRQHKLQAPPRGHRWLRDGNVFLLVAIETNSIASIVNRR